MSLVDDLTSLRRSPKCPLGAYLEALDGDERKALEDALAAPPSEISHVGLARVLKKYLPNGISDHTVRAHRADDRACACGPR